MDRTTFCCLCFFSFFLFFCFAFCLITAVVLHNRNLNKKVGGGGGGQQKSLLLHTAYSVTVMFLVFFFFPSFLMKLSPHFLLSFTSVLKLLQSYSYSLFTLHTASVQIEYGKRHQVLGNASEKLSLGC